MSEPLAPKIIRQISIKFNPTPIKSDQQNPPTSYRNVIINSNPKRSINLFSWIAAQYLNLSDNFYHPYFRVTKKRNLTIHQVYPTFKFNWTKLTKGQSIIN